jgi:glycosyltransferase involved in cell wall biosynthesis
MCPSYVAPLVTRAPVLLVHHGSYEGYPEAFDWWPRTRARAAYTLSAHRADHVSTVSEHSRADIIRFYHLRPAKISVIPDGVDIELFRPMTADGRVDTWRRTVFGDDRPFLMYVGKSTRRRNLPALVEAFARLRRHEQIPHRLALFGTALAGTPIEPMIDALGLTGDVTTVPFASHEELALAYNAADMLVYPSSYEGFGMPVLEAMACGTPAVALDNSAFGEFAGGVALLLADAEVPTLHRAIAGLLDDHDRLAAMAAAGPARAAAYDWSSITRRYVELIVETAGG